MNNNVFQMPVALNVVIPAEEQLVEIELQPDDQILVEAGFWTKAECVAYHTFRQINMSALENKPFFLQMYQSELSRRAESEKPKSNLIMPSKQIITP